MSTTTTSAPTSSPTVSTSSSTELSLENKNETRGQCIICCDEKIKDLIQCNFCHQTACQSCVKKYLLESASEAHCMFPNCRKLWNRSFLCLHFPSSFLDNQWKKHRKQILIDRERALLPATQPFVARATQLQQLEDARTNLYREQSHLKRRLEELIPQLQEATRAIKDFKNGVDGKQQQQHDAEGKTRKSFIRECPQNGCRGYLSTKWICGLCHAHVCNQCFEIKFIQPPTRNQTDTCSSSLSSSPSTTPAVCATITTTPTPITHDSKQPEHVCNPDILASAQQVKRDSKQCPKCGVWIFKSVGCSQMWCTSCNTAFDWNSGKEIVNAVIHNPHYFEYQRRQQEEEQKRTGGGTNYNTNQNRQQQQNQHGCQQQQDIEDLYFSDWNDPQSNRTFQTIRQSVLHLREETLRKWPALPTTPEEQEKQNQDLRIRYLQGSLDEKQWQTLLHQREKSSLKKHEVHMIIQAAVQVASDILRNVHARRISNGEAKQQLRSFVDYVNESLATIAHEFNSTSIFSLNPFTWAQIDKPRSKKRTLSSSSSSSKKRTKRRRMLKTLDDDE